MYLRILANMSSLLGSSSRSLLANSQQSLNAETHFSLLRIRRALSLQVSLTGYAFTPAIQQFLIAGCLYLDAEITTTTKIPSLR